MDFKALKIQSIAPKKLIAEQWQLPHLQGEIIPANQPIFLFRIRAPEENLSMSFLTKSSAAFNQQNDGDGRGAESEEPL